MADAVAELADEVAQLAGASVALERPSDEAHGDYATNVALQLAGERRRPPREIAAELAERAAGLAGVARAEVAGPGFLNLFLDDAWFVDALAGMLAAGDAYGAGSPAVAIRSKVPRRATRASLLARTGRSGRAPRADVSKGAYQ